MHPWKPLPLNAPVPPIIPRAIYIHLQRCKHLWGRLFFTIYARLWILLQTKDHVATSAMNLDSALKKQLQSKHVLLNNVTLPISFLLSPSPTHKACIQLPCSTLSPCPKFSALTSYKVFQLVFTPGAEPLTSEIEEHSRSCPSESNLKPQRCTSIFG